MEITVKQILQIMPNARANISKNKNFAGYSLEGIVLRMNKYAKEFGIDSPLRWAHYLAQIAHESAEFRYSEEIASGKAYEGRKDLGNIYKGDGVRFKGRGLIQITGRCNYRDYGGYCGYDLLKNPELLCKPVGAIRSSMWFCWKKGILELADRDDFTGVTKKVNGGTNGWDDRKKYLGRAYKALCGR